MRHSDTLPARNNYYGEGPCLVATAQNLNRYTAGRKTYPNAHTAAHVRTRVHDGFREPCDSGPALYARV